MANKDLALMAHLMRRAGFGASRDELEARVAQGYDNVVEELLEPGDEPGVEVDLLFRSFPNFIEGADFAFAASEMTYRMINSKHQLQEKIALFWHTILCSADSKVCNERNNVFQIDHFRDHGTGSFKDLLMFICQDPCMLFYLDNQENHKGAINENFGRELLELFSMGVGMDGEYNYTQEDVIECARAFTGWALAPNYPLFPYGRCPFQFRYDASDHDDGDKTFLGETGPWNGDDIVEMICKQPATARFVSRKLYDWFVADEPPTRTWRLSEPRDMEAIKALEKAYFDSGYSIKAMLRVLFTSDFFKNEAVHFAKVKNPADVVVGTIRMAQASYDQPGTGVFAAQSRARGEGGAPPGGEDGILATHLELKYMGMELFQPPTVEGWQMGSEWMNSGSLVDRVNFATRVLGDTELPGVKSMIDRLMAQGESLSAEQVVDSCLDLMGPLTLDDETRQEIVDHVTASGEMRQGTKEEKAEFTRRAAQIFQLVASTSAYQFG
jgi:uncharacterized protein (DUF1800 family)